jgi:hypothetical protein
MKNSIIFLAFATAGLSMASEIEKTPSQSEVTTEVICTYAPSQNKTVKQISSLLRNASLGSEITLLASGLKIVRHSSGAKIITGSSGYVSGTMTGAVITSKIITVGVLVAGTAIAVELVCVPKNHPELVDSVIADAKKYYKAGEGGLVELFEKVKTHSIVSQDKFYELMGETWYERLIRNLKSMI